MGDVVGVNEPNMKDAKKVIMTLLRNEGLDPDIIDPRMIEAFATGIAGFSHRPITPEQFKSLVQEDQAVSRAWDMIRSCG